MGGMEPSAADSRAVRSWYQEPSGANSLQDLLSRTVANTGKLVREHVCVLSKFITQRGAWWGENGENCWKVRWRKMWASSGENKAKPSGKKCISFSAPSPVRLRFVQAASQPASQLNDKSSGRGIPWIRLMFAMLLFCCDFGRETIAAWECTHMLLAPGSSSPIPPTASAPEYRLLLPDSGCSACLALATWQLLPVIDGDGPRRQSDTGGRATKGTEKKYYWKLKLASQPKYDCNQPMNVTLSIFQSLWALTKFQSIFNNPFI